MLTNKTHKLILGIILLLLVDIIWVSSSELTKVRNHQKIYVLNDMHNNFYFLSILVFVSK